MISRIMSEIKSIEIRSESDELEKIKYASEVCELEYVTDFIKTLNKAKLLHLNRCVDRAGTIGQFSGLLKDIDCAIKIEAGIFEFTLVYCVSNNYVDDLMPSVYYDKACDLMHNIARDDTVNNETLVELLTNSKIDPQKIAFMKPQDIHPERWKDIVSKINLREEKKKNIATTDLYQCWKCKERKCRVYEIQTRSIDEPSTKFITCLNCHNVMKK